LALLQRKHFVVRFGLADVLHHSALHLRTVKLIITPIFEMSNFDFFFQILKLEFCKKVSTNADLLLKTAGVWCGKVN